MGRRGRGGFKRTGLERGHGGGTEVVRASLLASLRERPPGLAFPLGDREPDCAWALRGPVATRACDHRRWSVRLSAATAGACCMLGKCLDAGKTGVALSRPPAHLGPTWGPPGAFGGSRSARLPSQALRAAPAHQAQGRGRGSGVRAGPGLPLAVCALGQADTEVPAGMWSGGFWGLSSAQLSGRLKGVSGIPAPEATSPSICGISRVTHQMPLTPRCPHVPRTQWVGQPPGRSLSCCFCGPLPGFLHLSIRQLEVNGDRVRREPCARGCRNGSGCKIPFALYMG